MFGQPQAARDNPKRLFLYSPPARGKPRQWWVESRDDGGELRANPHHARAPQTNSPKPRHGEVGHSTLPSRAYAWLVHLPELCRRLKPPHTRDSQAREHLF